MYCEYCGAKFEEKDHFCGKCGMKRKKVSHEVKRKKEKNVIYKNEEKMESIYDTPVVLTFLFLIMFSSMLTIFILSFCCQNIFAF